MVHLSHRGAGDRFFEDALRALERETCWDARDDDEEEDEEEDASVPDVPDDVREANANAAAPASPPEGSNLKKAPRCAPWRVVTADAASGFSDDKVAFETLGASEGASEKNVFVTFESPRARRRRCGTSAPPKPPGSRTARCFSCATRGTS